VAGLDNDVKRWMCPSKKHQLGLVRRSSRGIQQLMLYRNAVDLCAESPDEVDVIGVLVGEMMDVVCSVCGRTRTWVPGQEALDRLVESVINSRGNRNGKAG
jgi:hypothetical protein